MLFNEERLSMVGRALGMDTQIPILLLVFVLLLPCQQTGVQGKGVRNLMFVGSRTVLFAFSIQFILPRHFRRKVILPGKLANSFWSINRVVLKTLGKA